MLKTLGGMLGAGMLMVALLGAGPATSPPVGRIDITKVTCGDLKAATPLDRSAIVMFYWGYAAAKAGATSFKTGILRSATAELITECSNNASESVLDAMSRINVKAF
jgi:hypothetical protein